jgi:hypothetical protein
MLTDTAPVATEATAEAERLTAAGRLLRLKQSYNDIDSCNKFQGVVQRIPAEIKNSRAPSTIVCFPDSLGNESFRSNRQVFSVEKQKPL